MLRLGVVNPVGDTTAHEDERPKWGRERDDACGPYARNSTGDGRGSCVCLPLFGVPVGRDARGDSGDESDHRGFEIPSFILSIANLHRKPAFPRCRRGDRDPRYLWAAALARGRRGGAREALGTWMVSMDRGAHRERGMGVDVASHGSDTSRRVFHG